MLNRSVPRFFMENPLASVRSVRTARSPMILSRLEPDKPGFDLHFSPALCRRD